MSNLLEVSNLRVTFPTDDGDVHAVDNLSLSLTAGETVAIVGESGSGKTVTSLSIMGLHNLRSTKISGSIKIIDDGAVIDVVTDDSEKVRSLRGRVVSMIFQDPMSSLHPYYRISKQLSEAYLVHHPGKKAEAKKRTVEMLDLVGIPEAAKRARDYPHQFSGGMRQRVMIAMALMNNPKILIADEPTTALDVTVQAQILTLLKEIQKEFNMGILLITHDLGVVAQVADRVSVMYAGNIVEQASADDIFYRPLAPYTVGLLHSVPRVSYGIKKRLISIPGQPPSLINLPHGCAFAPRCTYISFAPVGSCAASLPDLVGLNPGHTSRCHIDEKLRPEIFAHIPEGV
jgi:peptide/nickel transport system ATP-binding protein